MFTPQRLIIARERRGFTQIRLAEDADCSASLVDKLERGLANPSNDVMTRLEHALGVPSGFLTAPPLPELPVDRVSFRALSKMTAAQRDSALTAGRFAMEFTVWLDAEFELPRPDVPDLSGLEPELAAENLRATWRIPDGSPIPNMVHLLELHGVRVFSLAERNVTVDAFSFFEQERPFVFLNTMKSAERSRFDAGHEAGHLALHRQAEKLPDSKERETEAQEFAAAFLMPKTGVLARRPRTLTLDELVRAKRTWGVSLMAYLYRLHQIGVVTEYQYKRLTVEASRRGYRKAEPNPMTRETSQVFRKVFAELRRRGLSRRDIAHQLRMPAKDLDDLAFGLALTALDSN